MYRGREQQDAAGDFSRSADGGLKIQFYNEHQEAVAFVWMRGSKTEPIFRISADLKGNDEAGEAALLQLHADMVREADRCALSCADTTS